MNSTSKIALAAIVGASVGAAAVHGLQAQVKPKAYQVTELEILDPAAYKAWLTTISQSQKGAGGRNLRTAAGKVVAFVGDPPKNVGIVEFDSLDQAVAWRNSEAFKELSPQRDKVVKIIRQYTVEATQ